MVSRFVVGIERLRYIASNVIYLKNSMRVVSDKATRWANSVQAEMCCMKKSM
jgi:hypothetical protein